MNEVRTRDEAIALIDQAFQTWSTNLAVVLDSAQSAARAACEEADRTVGQRANEVAAIEAILTASEPEKRRELESRLVRAREAREQAKRAQVRIEGVASGVAQLIRTHASYTTTQVAGARAQLSAMSRALEGYRSGGALFGGRGSVSSGTPRVTTGDAGSSGHADIDVSAADLNDNRILDDNGANGTFGKGGLSRADYRWAVQTWNDVVGPGVASGKTRDDFAARDTQSNAKPLRRTADVYDMFLGSDRIRADRQADGSLNIINGRHRLLIARELGIKHLPGDVR
ncbi:MAG TPA: hypothetical protein VFJ19_18820 [Nocardioidaceae bacterium]|nr:hypothetical protein [Nocardioidaceae bacterium]